jgi:hypothetical protein
VPAASSTAWPTQNPDADDGGFTGAALELIIGKLDELKPARVAKPHIPWEACHPIWQTGQIPLTAGAGTLQQGNLYGPETPFYWDLRTISVWGFTAGTVTVYLNSVNGEILGQTITPGQFTWSANEILGPQDNLIFGAAGVTGSVSLTVRAIEVQAAWLPEYLM